ncbi:hypothetical protein DEO72_LG1g3148 [Vigna unguiculata]|uniref:Uncharacterized protein n=1 Tax=Vigna unguiculata TaxID=3917 RepID=A0A4D6KN47_VIGUN|nr:hypothetical protein DEO72_LG1g3148 [Vigna unguiculata]
MVKWGDEFRVTPHHLLPISQTRNLNQNLPPTAAATASSSDHREPENGSNTFHPSRMQQTQSPATIALRRSTTTHPLAPAAAATQTITVCN